MKLPHIHALCAFSLAVLCGAAAAATSPRCPGETGFFFVNNKRRNPQQGGFVSHSADIEDEYGVFIAPTAAVCGSAHIADNARIYGQAIVRDNAEVLEKARVYGDAVIEGDSVVTGRARVYENARVSGSSFISGTARLKGWIKVVDEDLDSGVHEAPQYTPAELRALAAQARRQEAAAELERKRGRTRQLAQELRKLWESSDEDRSMTVSSDGCTLTYQELSHTPGDYQATRYWRLGFGSPDGGLRWKRRGHQVGGISVGKYLHFIHAASYPRVKIWKVDHYKDGRQNLDGEAEFEGQGMRLDDGWERSPELWIELDKRCGQL